MGCGISTLDAEDATLSRQSNRLRQRTVVRPVADSNLAPKKPLDNGNESVDSLAVVKPQGGDEEVKAKPGGGPNDERLKGKWVEKQEAQRVSESGGKAEQGGNDNHVKNEEMHEENKDREDSIIGPGSPSFREYCIDYDSGDRSSMGDFNDCDSRDSTKNGSSDDDSTMRKNKPQNEAIINSNKEPEKKERRGRGFRNVIHKGKNRGKRNLLNFGCYNSNTASHDEHSLNQVVRKTA